MITGTQTFKDGGSETLYVSGIGTFCIDRRIESKRRGVDGHVFYGKHPDGNKRVPKHIEKEILKQYDEFLKKKALLKLTLAEQKLLGL